jgi:hypothetical protein
MKPVLLASKLKRIPCSSAQSEFSVLAFKLSVPMCKAPVSIAVAEASNARCKNSVTAMVDVVERS